MQAPQKLVDGYVAAGETLGAALTYAMIEVMDAGIGLIDQALHDLGVAENTLLMFTSDNGPYLGEVAGVSLDRFNYGLRGAKHYVFEGGIRVPAILRWPAGLQGGRTVTQMLHFTDWLPTLASIARLPVVDAARIDGHDVGSVLAGDSSEVDPVRFWQNNRYAPRVEGNAAMRDGRWKLVRPIIPELMRVTDADRAIDRALNLHEPGRITHVDTTPLPTFETGPPPAPLLFDVEADPFEQHDLASEHPDRVARMSAAIERWFECVEADRQAIPDDWSLRPG
jgi:arylsulfatase A-like enzyme